VTSNYVTFTCGYTKIMRYTTGYIIKEYNTCHHVTIAHFA